MATLTKMTAMVAVGAAALFSADLPASADGAKKTDRSRTYAYRGYVLQKRGGYSYNIEDVANANTHPGDSRYMFSLPRQSISGPFDSGFFFDSAIRPRGGDAPYIN